MLILTRRVNEGIFIGSEEVEVTILEVRGKQVRLGIRAPRTMEIIRTEAAPARATESPKEIPV